MDGPIRVTTAILLLVPLLFAVVTVMVPVAPLRAVMGGLAALIAAGVLATWFYARPAHFEVSPAGLRIVWPLRSRLIPVRALRAAVVLSREAFRAEYGSGMRVGAGGLWGGFGRFVTSRQTFDLYVSRMEPLVLVRLSGGRPLLVTPEEAERFAEAVAGIASQAA